MLAAEHQRDTAGRIELDHHVRALVRRPNVALLIGFHGVRKGPGIKVVPDLAQEFSVGSEFKQLRGRCGIGRPGGVAPGEHKDVALRIHRNARDFAKIEVGRELQKIRSGVEANFRRLLSESRRREHQRARKEKVFHRMRPPRRSASYPGLRRQSPVNDLY